MRKRVISGLLALTLVLSGASPMGEVVGLPTAGSAVEASAETYGNYEYDVLDDGTVEITGYTGSDTKVVVPSKINGKVVSRIGGWAFQFSETLTSITIPASVTYIEGFAFYGCESLTSVTIPDSVTSIGESVFSQCVNLTSITIPNSIKSLPFGTFSGCTGLKSIKIPKSITSIGSFAFSGCESLTSITIPDSITRIEDFTFEFCESLKSITIPDTVTYIGGYAFSFCESLKDVYYTGSKGDWSKISIDSTNDYLINAKVHYNYAPNHKHTYTSKITKQPTCTTKGTKISTCSICGETKTESIPAKGHSYTTKVVAPTYTAQGYTLHTCKTCGKSYKDNYKPKKARTSISTAKISVSNQTYNGKTLKPKVTVKLGSKTLRSGADYTVSYKNNKNTGKATVIVTGRNAYTGTKSASFIIKPKKAALTNVTSPKTKQVKLRWKKDSQATGYQLQVALNKKFTSGRKTVNISKKTTTAKTIKPLKKGKKYYARVRAYKKVGKTKYYGNWSALKTVRCK